MCSPFSRRHVDSSHLVSSSPNDNPPSLSPITSISAQQRSLYSFPFRERECSLNLYSTTSLHLSIDTHLLCFEATDDRLRGESAEGEEDTVDDGDRWEDGGEGTVEGEAE